MAKAGTARGTIEIAIDSTKFSTGASVIKQKLQELETKAKAIGQSMQTMGVSLTNTSQKFQNMGTGAGTATTKLQRLGLESSATGMKIRKMGMEANGGAMTKFQNMGRAAQGAARDISNLGQKSQQAATQVRGVGNAASQTAQGMTRVKTSTVQATQATSRFNAGSIGTAASIGTMGAGLVSLEASMSNYAKAEYKVEKSTLAVQKARDLMQSTTASLMAAQLNYDKAMKKGNKSAEEMAVLEQRLSYYKQKLSTDTEDLQLKQEKLNIANMDYADTQKLMASSIATTLLGTVSSAAMMMQGLGNTTALTTVKTKLMGVAAMLTGRQVGASAAASSKSAIANVAAGKAAAAGGVGFRAMAAGIKSTAVAFMTNPIGIAIMAVTTAVTALWAAWNSNFMGFRDGVHSLVDGLQKFYDAIKRVLVPLQWLEDGLKALGIDIGKNIDEWQEYEKAERRLTDALKDGIITQSEYDEQLRQLQIDSGKLKDETRALTQEEQALRMEMGLTAEKTTELDMTGQVLTQTMGQLETQTDSTGDAMDALTVDIQESTVATQTHSKAISADMAMLRQHAGATGAGQVSLETFGAKMREMAEDAKNHERDLADNKHMVLQWANAYKIAMTGGAGAIALFEDEGSAELQTLADNITKYGGDAAAVLDKNGIDWQRLGITIQGAMGGAGEAVDGFADNAETALTRFNTSAQQTSATVAQLTHMIVELSKKKSNALSDLSNITDAANMTKAQVDSVIQAYNNMKQNEFLNEQGFQNMGMHGATDEGQTVYVMGDGETALNADGSINYEKLQELGDISARNLEKIKEQSRQLYNNAANEYLSQLGLVTRSTAGTHNSSVDDKEDLATVREMAQTNNYANPSHPTQGVDYGGGGSYTHAQGGNSPSGGTSSSSSSSGSSGRSGGGGYNEQMYANVRARQATYEQQLKWLGPFGAQFVKKMQRGWRSGTRVRTMAANQSRISNEYNKVLDDLEKHGLTMDDVTVHGIYSPATHEAAKELFDSGLNLSQTNKGDFISTLKTKHALEQKKSKAHGLVKQVFTAMEYYNRGQGANTTNHSKVDVKKRKAALAELNKLLGTNYSYNQLGKFYVDRWNIDWGANIDQGLPDNISVLDYEWTAGGSGKHTRYDGSKGETWKYAGLKGYLSAEGGLVESTFNQLIGDMMSDPMSDATKKFEAEQQELKDLIEAEKERVRKIQEAKDKELADMLAERDRVANAARAQEQYQTEMKAYNQDMALYNMIQRMFPDQTPAWTPTAPSLQTRTMPQITPMQTYDTIQPTTDSREIFYDWLEMHGFENADDAGVDRALLNDPSIFQNEFVRGEFGTHAQFTEQYHSTYGDQRQTIEVFQK